jgi:hypothetical protein
MGALAVDLLAVVLALTALYARPRVILGVLIGTVLLIPSTLIAPHLHTQYATVNHIVIGAAALRLAAMARRGAMARAAFRATPLHLALALLAATWAFAGIVFAPQTLVTVTAEQRMVGLAFVIAFFILTLALLREIDDPWLVMRMLTGALAVTAVIAVIERLTGDSYGHWLFATAGHPGPTDAAHVLETRAGHVRVRASGEFALAYAWIAVMLLPVATIVAVRMRRWLWVGVPVVALVVLAIYFTYSRSAAAAVPVALVLLFVGVRDRRTLAVAAATVVASLTLFLADPTVRHHLSLATDQGSVGIRFQRLPPILDAVAHHPFLGLGLGGLQSIAVTTTDNFYLSAYGETGAVGAAVLVVLCVTALAQTIRGLTVRDAIRRSVITASVIGFIGFLASGLFDDALLLGQPAQLAMLLLAMAVATAEPELGFAVLPKFSAPRVVFLTAAGALVGLTAFLLAPTVVSQERGFTTVSPLGVAVTGGGAVGPALIGTICDLSSAVATTLPQTHIDCRDDFTGAGLGTLRVSSPSTAQTLEAYTALTQAAHEAYYLGNFQTQPTGPPISARASAWKTAPATGAVLGFALAFIAPLPIRRRRPLIEPPEDPGPAAGAASAGSTAEPDIAASPVGSDATPPPDAAPTPRVRPPGLRPAPSPPVEPLPVAVEPPVESPVDPTLESPPDDRTLEPPLDPTLESPPDDRVAVPVRAGPTKPRRPPRQPPQRRAGLRPVPLSDKPVTAPEETGDDRRTRPDRPVIPSLDP